METGETSRQGNREWEAEERQGERTPVRAGRLEQMPLWSPDSGGTVIVWGFRIRFSDGRTACVPDLCDRKEDAERLLKRLVGAELTPDFLPDVLDDYLGEIYGLPFSQKS